MDSSSLAHCKWECQYHIVFIPKYRKKKLYGLVCLCKTNGGELPRLRWTRVIKTSPYNYSYYMQKIFICQLFICFFTCVHIAH